MNTDKHGKINIFVFATEATEITEAAARHPICGQSLYRTFLHFAQLLSFCFFLTFSTSSLLFFFSVSPVSSVAVTSFKIIFVSLCASYRIVNAFAAKPLLFFTSYLLSSVLSVSSVAKKFFSLTRGVEIYIILSSKTEIQMITVNCNDEELIVSGTN
jgi:hypothetical protein